ncbi:MAG: hypothetical protein M3Q24_00245, partial [bacterium]|nr:hypothetical protein [bacterium]
VIEFQERGAIHYHSIFFNLKYIHKRTLADLWGEGFIEIKAVEHVDNVGAYMAKYMSKNFKDNRLDGQKRYFSSKYLQRPIEIKNQYKATIIAKSIPEKYLVHEKEFESSYHGIVKYRQYKLDKTQTLFDVVANLTEFL